MAEQAQQGPQLQIHKLYIKETSFTIQTPEKAFATQWQPELNVNLDVSETKLENNVYEVVLKVTCDVKNSDEKTFDAEVTQAGIFEISGLEDAHLDAALKAHCPNLLYPYAREAMSDIVMRGGFPQLALAPVNFDALYAQQQAEAQGAEEATKH